MLKYVMEMIIVVAVLVFSAILHEIMHGWTAYKLGDPTAKDLGRLTLNPIPHIDPIMSVLLPLLLVLSGSPILFGAAKPIPVIPMYFQDPRKDMALVALAGPLTNIFIAVLAAGIFHVLPADLSLIKEFLYIIIYVNLILGFLNLILIPPLDGSKVFSIILPDHIAAQYEQIQSFGIFILFFLLMFPIGEFSLGSLLSKLIFFSLQLLGV